MKSYTEKFFFGIIFMGNMNSARNILSTLQVDNLYMTDHKIIFDARNSGGGKGESENGPSPEEKPRVTGYFSRSP